MHVSGRYRDSAAECLSAAQEASQSHRRKLHLSMAIEAALIKGARYLNGK
jgi:hypothetical protein